MDLNSLYEHSTRNAIHLLQRWKPRNKKDSDIALDKTQVTDNKSQTKQEEPVKETDDVVNEEELPKSGLLLAHAILLLMLYESKKR